MTASGCRDNTFRFLLAGFTEGINDCIGAGMFGFVDVLGWFDTFLADGVDVAEGSVCPDIICASGKNDVFGGGCGDGVGDVT
jgi:hypothetical protein